MNPRDKYKPIPSKLTSLEADAHRRGLIRGIVTAVAVEAVIMLLIVIVVKIAGG